MSQIFIVNGPARSGKTTLFTKAVDIQIAYIPYGNLVYLQDTLRRSNIKSLCIDDIVLCKEEDIDAYDDKVCSVDRLVYAIETFIIDYLDYLVIIVNTDEDLLSELVKELKKRLYTSTISICKMEAIK